MKVPRRDFLKTSLAVVGGSQAAYGEGAGTSQSASALVVAEDLRCESLRAPLGIDALPPRLGWRLRATDPAARDQRQTAYQILVAGSEATLAADRGDLWDSGKVASAEQLHVPYAGRPLASAQRCHWKLRVWDGEDRPSPFSPASWWEMGLLAPSDWSGLWIGDGRRVPERDEEHYADDPAPLLRTRFQVAGPVRRARLYASGLGYYELRLNGTRVSDHALDPAWTSLGARVLYTTHDVTGMLRPGENALGALLGNGWYNPLPLRMWGRINLREHLRTGRPRLIAQLNLEYEDGAVQSVVSDRTWKVAGGPIVRNSVYLGEAYDARREQPGWDEPGFDASGWASAEPADTSAAARDASPPLGPLRAQALPPIRVTSRLRPVRVTEPAPGVFVFDLGQNFAGWPRLRVEGPRGVTVRMRTGELLNPDGSLNGRTVVAGQIKGRRADGALRGGPGAPETAFQVDSYTLRGEGLEDYTPRFTFHGFRYVEVTGFPGKPTRDAIEGLRLHTDVESAGSFACSNPRLDDIQGMVRATLTSNLFSVQSDCPGREKFQYGGDIVATSEMACLNYDMASFYAKTVQDHADAVRGEGWFPETAPWVGISAEGYAEEAGPIGWGLCHPLLVAQLYRYYGDERIVREQYAAARRWVDLLAEHAEGHVVDRCIGDHESLDPKPIALIATAQFFQSARLVEGFGRILGRTGEAERYAALAERIRAAFVERFLDPGTGRFDLGTQACQATALHMGLVPESERADAVRIMIDQVLREHGGHVAAGIFGTRYLLNALTEAGRADVAFEMVNQDGFPGWGYMLERGATTLWEHWEFSDDTYSHNHPMFGSVSEWFFKALGGIAPDASACGFDVFTLRPQPVGGLEWVDCRYQSARGPIVSNWRLEGDRLRLVVEVPVNTRALLRVPTRDPASVVEGGSPAEQAPAVTRRPSRSEDAAEFELGSGRYVFEAAAPAPAR